MAFFLESLGFGVAVVFILIGVLGATIPIVPGPLLVWLTLLVYAVLEGFAAIDWVTFTVLSILLLIAGTSDIWLPLIGAKVTGASGWAIIAGAAGSLIGLVVLSLPGAIIGYAAGILLAEYYRFRDWNKAIKSSVGGVAGFGISTMVELGAGILTLIIFIQQVLTYTP